MYVRLVFVSLVALAILGACGGDADPPTDTTTAPPIGGPFPVADLTVTITHPDRDTVEYRVVCLGDTATVTPIAVPAGLAIDEQAACTVLADAGVQQRLVEGPPDDEICTQQYGGPDLAAIVGSLDDQSVDTTVDRVNGCGISTWDRLLAGFLPPAVGVTE